MLLAAHATLYIDNIFFKSIQFWLKNWGSKIMINNYEIGMSRFEYAFDIGRPFQLNESQKNMLNLTKPKFVFRKVKS